MNTSHLVPLPVVAVLLSSGLNTVIAATDPQLRSLPKDQLSALESKQIAVDIPANRFSSPTDIGIESNAANVNKNVNKKTSDKSASLMWTQPMNDIPGLVRSAWDSPQNELLMEVVVNNYQMDDLVAIYHFRNSNYIPLSNLAEIIYMAIKADAVKGTAEGFIFNEQRSFFLDTNRGEITLSGVLNRYEMEKVRVRNFEDIYVNADLLSSWLSLNISADLFASRLIITSTHPLPFQQRLAREKRIEKVKRNQRKAKNDYHRYPGKFSWLNYPFVNQNIRIGAIRNTEDDWKSAYSYTTYATAGVADMDASLYLSGNKEDALSEHRISLGRHDPEGKLLGVLSATQYQLGHIIEPRMEQVTLPARSQVGASVSNYPLQRQHQYDVHVFHGELSPDWEVELYHNSALIAYQATDDKGQYLFDNVPLLFGLNIFRLVFYGPQGQMREEVQKFQLGDALTTPGKHFYNTYVGHTADGGSRLVTQHEIGLTKGLSSLIQFASIPLNGTYLLTNETEQHNFLDLGFSAFHKTVFLHGNIIDDIESGHLFDWGFQTRLGSFIIDSNATYLFNNFVSEKFPQKGVPVSQQSNIKLSTAIPKSFLPRIPLHFNFERTVLEDGSKITRLEQRTSLSIFKFAASNSFNMTYTSGQSSVTSGIFQISQFTKNFSLRGTLSYLLRPEADLSAVSLSANRLRRWNNLFSFGLTRNLNSDVDQAFFSVNKGEGVYTLGFNARYSTGGVIDLNVEVSVGLGRDPRTNRIVLDRRPIADFGNVSALVYLDDNRNNQRDVNEKIIEDAELLFSNGESTATDKTGMAFVAGLPVHTDLALELDSGSLEDPLWVAKDKGYKLVLRPGHITEVEIPIVKTGEIDGTVSIRYGDTIKEIGGITLEIVDVDGVVLDSTKSAFDGFYLFSQVPLGSYFIRPSEKEVTELNLVAFDPIEVNITNTEPVIYGKDFVVEVRP